MSFQLRPTQQPQQERGYNEYNTYNHGYYQQAYAQQLPPVDMTRPQSQASSSIQPPLPMAATMYHQDGLARTHTWIANQSLAVSPPPPAKPPLSEWTGSGTGTDSTFDRRIYSPTLPPRPPREDRRICGIKRDHFSIVLAIGVFLMVVGTAVGVGVGLGTRSSGREVSAANIGAVSSSSSITTTPTSTPTTTTASPTPSFTGTLVSSPVICPQDNNTVYIAQGSAKPFNIQCGRDYNSADGAKDIKHVHQATMAECVDTCGARDDCVGVGYGYYKGSFRCWMKSQLGEPNESSQWYFAQLQRSGRDS
ncbi:hypothetical protein M426DRAFT_320311 [Hypoxylon sp. CI-4A]|nr:hypothetical protein M426DRAFT_320311 [Hypoxylon sp. CI-4A]